MCTEVRILLGPGLAPPRRPCGGSYSVCDSLSGHGLDGIDSIIAAVEGVPSLSTGQGRDPL